MATTAKQIVDSALRKLMSLSRGQTFDPKEEADALYALNEMLSNLINENFMVPVVTKVSQTLTVNKTLYTIGTGADINTTKPFDITFAEYIDTSSNPTPFTYPMELVDINVFESHPNPNLSGIPIHLWYENNATSTTANVHIYPSPYFAGTLNLWVMQPLLDIPSLQTSINMDDRYRLFLAVSLAAHLAPEYGLTETELYKHLISYSASLQRKIKRSNFAVPIALVDAAGYGKRGVYPQGLFPCIGG